jgi:phospholipase/carboxylesterase
MREQIIGSLNTVLAGGTDREGGGEGPVVVLLHGYGAPAKDLVPLWRTLDVPHNVRFAFPCAPHPIEPSWPDARAWWHFEVERFQRAVLDGRLVELADEVPRGAEASREVVSELIDALRTDLHATRIILGGFSQGAILSLDTALRTDVDLSGLVILSGTLMAEHEWVPLMNDRSGLPVFQSHGTDDPLLPLALAERMRDHLRAAGMQVDWQPFKGGHTIPPQTLSALGAFLRKHLKTGTTSSE